MENALPEIAFLMASTHSEADLPLSYFLALK